MENRRQLAMQRKAEEDKARALEEDRKIKEDNEKRKREREEHTDKRPLRNVPKKVRRKNLNIVTAVPDRSFHSPRIMTPRNGSW